MIGFPRDEVATQRKWWHQGEMATPRVPEYIPVESTTQFEDDVHHLFAELQATLLSKHHDYGPRNIADSPGGALNGIRVRLWDKLARINNLLDAGVEPKHESLEDAFLDAANYATIAVLVMRKQWPA